MPFVQVYLKAGVTPEDLDSTGFYTALRKSVTTALYCKDDGGELRPDEVDVHFVTRPEADRTNWDVVVIVNARRTPTRTKEQTFRKNQLGDDLRHAVPVGLKVSGCINLQDAEWFEGEGMAQ